MSRKKKESKIKSKMSDIMATSNSYERKVAFSIDRGGTFTDVYSELVDTISNEVVDSYVFKLLSQDPSNYQDAPREGIRRTLEHFFPEREYPRCDKVDTRNILSIRMGTTVATNALLERQGERFVLVTTKGFKDIWHIGNQARPDIFDLEIKVPDVLYEDAIELDERVILGSKDAINAFGSETPQGDAVTKEKVLIEKALDEVETRNALKKIQSQGINSIAVVLMHGAVYPQHEILVGKIAKELGFHQVSLSHEVMQMVKLVPRGFTTSADAYLTPHIGRYLATFCAGFDDDLLHHVDVSFMQSDGGLTGLSNFSGHRAILSGPAGGVVGYALTSCLAVGAMYEPQQVVGFDMGGTSTDVSRYAGHYEHVFETTTAGVTIQAPQLDISTVAAGGGSKLKLEKGMFKVGPESVGAHPGPVCYRKGGELAVTDANVVLGRVVPKYFPHIFGADEKQPLDATGARKAFEALNVNISVEQVAYGFLKIANEAMCRPIRNLTQMRGYDLAQHTLACFGGAGGQHACAIARALGMKRVFIHRYSGILSAFGIGLADVVEDQQEPCALHILDSKVENGSEQDLWATFQRVQDKVSSKLVQQGFQSPSFERFLFLRYQGTDTPLMTPCQSGNTCLREIVNCFESNYQREFGFRLIGRRILIDAVRVRGSGISSARQAQLLESAPSKDDFHAPPQPLEVRGVYFENGWVDTNFFNLSDLSFCTLKGPAILLDPNSTIVLEPGCIAYVSDGSDVTIEIVSVPPPPLSPPSPSLSSSSAAAAAPIQPPSTQNKEKAADPIQLSLFSHRFMGIAEQMGRTLQRTSVSVNIKERLDFSCALFSPDGGLVANAPHIPVHLGAMQEAIRFQVTYNGEKITPGDVFVSNHPQLAGGSHLPDITVITPCFIGTEIVFWVASRGHHADVGGITPGSMPPNSKLLREEGCAIVSFRLVHQGEFQLEGIQKLLSTPSDPENPLCTGTRALEDVTSDLKAQVAANNHGVRLIQALAQEYSLTKVQQYMFFIQDNAEEAVRAMLRDFVAKTNKHQVVSQDHMDDGTLIKVTITFDASKGSAVFDFTGTGPQVSGNCNAPPAVTYSAIIYSLRCLIASDIPLNQGCLRPIEIIIPKESILNPASDRAVVGGNVLTSQRVVDVILKAFDASAASQGCMNNLTFGDESFGYYETIAGGAGAGPMWHGRSGVHTHMTNTRITDPEVLEKRLPVVLRQFSLRKQSGGKGLWCGGDGVVREIEFLRKVTTSILSERRERYPPFGLHGGGPGQCGINLFLGAHSKQEENLGGKNSRLMNPRDKIKVLTPGGGGFGSLPNTN